MGKFRDLTDMEFGMLKVIKQAETRISPSGRKRIFWVCQCSCESKTIVEVEAGNLTCGRQTSCGCVRNRKSSERLKTHGLANTRIHNTYTSMKQRCYNAKAQEYEQYGGRGIKICDEWLGENGFHNFFDWSMKNGYRDDLSIDHIDNDGNYEPGNCRWADRFTQLNNRQNTLYYDIGNGKEPLAVLCKRYNLDRTMVWKRLKRGWTIKEALELESRG